MKYMIYKFINFFRKKEIILYENNIKYHIQYNDKLNRYYIIKNKKYLYFDVNLSSVKYSSLLDEALYFKNLKEVKNFLKEYCFVETEDIFINNTNYENKYTATVTEIENYNNNTVDIIFKYKGIYHKVIVSDKMMKKMNEYNKNQYL